MSKPTPKPINLTPEQRAYCLEHYEKMSLGELSERVLGVADVRSPECKAIRAFLAGEGKPIIEAKPESAPSGLASAVVLTEEQKKRCEELVRSGKIESSVELTRLVFGDPNIKSLSHHWRAIYNYAKDIAPNQFDASEEPVDEKIYRAPDKLQNLVGVVNTFVPTGDQRKLYNWNNLKSIEERQLKALMKYMRNYRFIVVASSYDKRVDRELFVSTFVRWCYDKPDLTEIEVDQMISAAEETVNILGISRSIKRMDTFHDAILAGDVIDENTGKPKKFGMTEVEQINAVRTQYDKAKKNLQTWMEKLETSRSKRIDAARDRSASFLNLVEDWMKDEQKRKDLIALGKQEKDEDKREVGRIRDMDDAIAIVLGQTEEEGGS